MARDEAPNASDEAGAQTIAPAAERNATVVSVDAMGGDLGPEAVLDGLILALDACANDDAGALQFLIHGPESVLGPLLADRPRLARHAALRPCAETVEGSARPTEALRQGRESSMWRCLEAVAEGEADAALSLGNTGALLAMAMVWLRPAPGVARSAIAAHWPSRNPAGFNVVLDMGADVRAEARNLVDYALMGVEYARLTLSIERPRVALLNVGSEEIKGRSEITEAADRLRSLSAASASESDPGFDYVGFVEGDQISSTRADVIVTDGFTGNVALKTAEGTARLIGAFLKEAFQSDWRGRLGALVALSPLRRFRRRIDPRRVNGGVFLGLNGVVVKSHGGADAVGVAAAVALARRLGADHIADRIAGQVAKIAPDQDDPGTESRR